MGDTTSPPGSRRSRAAALAALILAGAPLLVPVPAAAQTRNERFGQRYRALDEAERGRALAAAREPSEGEIRRRTGRRADAPLRIEVLAVERERLDKNALPGTYRRRAEVTLYDYDSDRRSVATVDLESGRVESVFVVNVNGGQPPLTAAETGHALDLVFADPASAARLRANFARVASRPLRDPGELEVTGFVYLAESMPDRNSAETALCGRHRCAQLLVRTTDDVALELPIVDLSRERVLETRSFVPVPPPAAPAPAAPAAPAAAAAAAAPTKAAPANAEKKDPHAAH